MKKTPDLPENTQKLRQDLKNPDLVWKPSGGNTGDDWRDYVGAAHSGTAHGVC